MPLHSTEVLGMVLIVKLNVTHTLYLLQEIPHSSQHGQGLSLLPPASALS